MRRLATGDSVHLTAPHGEKASCRVVAVAGPWALLALPDPSAALPAWFDGEVFLRFFHGAHPVHLRGHVEPGRLAGEVRFHVSAAGGEPESRTAPRVPTSLMASLVDSTGTALEAAILDISAGGVRLAHRGRMEVGDRLHLRFPLGGLWIDVDAVVRSAWKGSSAAVFLHFRSGSTQAIGEWCVDALRTEARKPAHRGAPAPAPARR